MQIGDEKKTNKYGNNYNYFGKEMIKSRVANMKTHKNRKTIFSYFNSSKSIMSREFRRLQDGQENEKNEKI